MADSPGPETGFSLKGAARIGVCAFFNSSASWSGLLF